MRTCTCIRSLTRPAGAVPSNAVLGSGAPRASCGTAGYHIGDDPDPRTVAVCQKHRVPINHHARQLSARDFAEFDYILGMDTSNISNINRIRPAGSSAMGATVHHAH